MKIYDAISLKPTNSHFTINYDEFTGLLYVNNVALCVEHIEMMVHVVGSGYLSFCDKYILSTFNDFKVIADHSVFVLHNDTHETGNISCTCAIDCTRLQLIIAHINTYKLEIASLNDF